MTHGSTGWLPLSLDSAGDMFERMRRELPECPEREARQ